MNLQPTLYILNVWQQYTVIMVYKDLVNPKYC